jgi:hypothetical protein
VDFLLTAKRDLAAARRFLKQAINLYDVPEKITIDESGASTAAIESVKVDACVDILMRQNKCLNNIVEPSNKSPERCSDSSRFGVPALSMSASKNYVHDPQGADGLPRGQNHVYSQPVIQPCRLVTKSATQRFSARLHCCDKAWHACLKPLVREVLPLHG